jgi:hypothetical protein
MRFLARRNKSYLKDIPTSVGSGFNNVDVLDPVNRRPVLYVDFGRSLI